MLSHVAIYPASHYVVSQEKMERSIKEIYDEMTERVAQFESQGKLLEAQRIKQRTEYDIEMLRETGFARESRTIRESCPGVNRVLRLLRCSTIFRKIFCCLSTNPM